MRVPDAKLAELLALAQTAEIYAPSPWHNAFGDEYIYDAHGAAVVGAESDDGGTDARVARFVAACDPATIRALVEERQASRDMYAALQNVEEAKAAEERDTFPITERQTCASCGALLCNSPFSVRILGRAKSAFLCAACAQGKP